MSWKKYENDVFKACEDNFKENVSKNEYKIGRYSKRKRQIDILVENTVANNTIRTIIDCKQYSKKIDVKCVESFIAMCDDLNADKGIMITNVGYTKSALKRAHNNPKYIELDICRFEEFKDMFQSFGAFPYSGSNAVFLIAPLGYLIDGRRNEIGTCLLYQIGYKSLEEAASKEQEFAYVNFWNKTNFWDKIKFWNKGYKLNKTNSINSLIKYQNNYIQVKNINYIRSINRDDAVTKIRVAHNVKKGFNEITGFVEFKYFIFFCVWLCKEENTKRNIRKLETIMKQVIPIQIKDNSTSSNI